MPRSPGISGERPPRAEWMLVAGLTLVALVVRLVFPAGRVIEHFDEGVYAANTWIHLGEGRTFPYLYLYAPPLVPALIEAGIVLTGPDWGPFWPGLLSGICLPASVWWMLRNPMGTATALAAATAAALGGLWVLYSRTALVDMPLILALLWSVYFWERAMTRPSFRSITAAAVMGAVAWWVKYTGWLPLAIGATSTVAVLLFEPTWRPRWRSLAGTAVAIVGLTVSLWSPVWWWLQPHGGYAVVARNHRQFLVGPEQWLGAAEAQLRHWHHFSQGGLDALAIGCVYLVAAWYRPGKSAAKSVLLGHALLALILAALSYGTSSAWILLPLAVLGLRRVLPIPAPSPLALGPSLLRWFLLVWLGALTVAVPLYMPYPRLLLTWALAICLFAAAGMVDLIGAIERQWYRSRRRTAAIAGTVAAGALLLILPHTERPVAAWQDRSGWKNVASVLNRQYVQDVRDVRGNGRPSLVAVFGEPALFYHLRAQQVPSFVVGDVAALKPIPRESAQQFDLLLALGPQAWSAKDTRETVLRAIEEGWLEEVTTSEVSLSDLARVNLEPFSTPAPATKPRQWRLYRWSGLSDPPD